MCISYRKTGPFVWLYLCIALTLAGGKYAHACCGKTLARSASEGHEERGSHQGFPCLRCGLVLPSPLQNIRHEEVSRLPLMRTAWLSGWFFVDVTGTGTKCCVVDGNTAQRQRKLQRPDMFFVALEISKWVRNVVSPVCHIRARGRLSACVFADHLSHKKKKRRLRAACSVMTARAKLSEVLFHLSKISEGSPISKDREITFAIS